MEMARPAEVSVPYGGGCSGHVHHSPSLARRRHGDGAVFTPINEGSNKEGPPTDRSVHGVCAPFILIGRIFSKCFDLLNSTAVQTLTYLAFVALFQLLTESLRLKEECAHARAPTHPHRPLLRPPHSRLSHAPHPDPSASARPTPPHHASVYFDKMIADTFLDNHFDSSHNNFQSIRRVADFYEWGNNVLIPGLFANAGPCASAVGAYAAFESATDRPRETDFVAAMRTKGCNDDAWPDGEGSFHLGAPTAFSVSELTEAFDMMDWSEGLIFKQARAISLAPSP